MSNNHRQREKILPIRKGISIYKEISNLKPFINTPPSSLSYKLQKKKISDAEELRRKRDHCNDLLHVVRSLINLLEQTLINQSYAIFLTDEEGYIIDFRSDTETYKLYENYDANCGFLNHAINTDNSHDLWINSSQSPIIVDDLEHYTLNINGWIFCGVPLRDNEEKLIGLLEVAVPNETFPPHTRAILLSVARTIDYELSELNKTHNTSGKDNLEKYILNNLCQAVIALDKKLNILYVNQYGLEIIGLSEKDITGHSIFDVLTLNREVQKWLNAILKGQLEHTRRKISIPKLKKDFLIQVSELKNDKDELLGLLLVIE